MTVALEARIDKCEKEINLLKEKNSDMSLQQGKMDTKLDFITVMIKDLQDNVKKLTEQPAKRWDSLINTGITCVVSMLISGAVTFIIARH